MKRIIIALSVFLSGLSHSYIKTLDVASAISCNSATDSRYWTNAFNRTYGKPIRNEGGAFWWKAKGSLYNSEITEVFVSNKPYWEFVGVVLKDKPNVVVDGIRRSRVFPSNVYATNGFWVGSDNKIIMWHKKQSTKVFCAGGGNLPNKHYFPR
jgi:hypothetical protein